MKKMVHSPDNPEGVLEDMTEEELAQVAALQADIARRIAENPLYVDKRRSEYPSIGDQLDALFKAGAFPDDMAAKIQAVKDKYPKES